LIIGLWSLDAPALSVSSDQTPMINGEPLSR